MSDDKPIVLISGMKDGDRTVSYISENGQYEIMYIDHDEGPLVDGVDDYRVARGWWAINDDGYCFDGDPYKNELAGRNGFVLDDNRDYVIAEKRINYVFVDDKTNTAYATLEFAASEIERLINPTHLIETRQFTDTRCVRLCDDTKLFDQMKGPDQVDVWHIFGKRSNILLTKFVVSAQGDKQ